MIIRSRSTPSSQRLIDELYTYDAPLNLSRAYNLIVSFLLVTLSRFLSHTCPVSYSPPYLSSSQICGALGGFGECLREMELGRPEGEASIACLVGGMGSKIGAPGTRERVAKALATACRCVFMYPRSYPCLSSSLEADPQTGLSGSVDFESFMPTCVVSTSLLSRALSGQHPDLIKLLVSCSSLILINGSTAFQNSSSYQQSAHGIMRLMQEPATASAMQVGGGSLQPSLPRYTVFMRPYPLVFCLTF